MRNEIIFNCVLFPSVVCMFCVICLFDRMMNIPMHLN